MPFQPINYAGIAPQGFSALDELAANLKKGMEVRQAPEEFSTQNELRKSQALKASQEGAKAKMIADILKKYGSTEQGQTVGAVGSGGDSGDDFGRLLFNKFLLGQAETPAMQMGREVATARAKQQATQDLPTGETITRYQQSVNQVEPFIDKMKEIIDLPSPIHAMYIPYRASSVAAHSAAVNAAIDSYLAVKGWKPTKENIEVARGIIDRHPFESDSAYRERIKKETVSALKGSIPYFKSTKAEFPKIMNQILAGEHKTFKPSEVTQVMNGVSYIKKDGKWYRK